MDVRELAVSLASTLLAPVGAIDGGTVDTAVALLGLAVTDALLEQLGDGLVQFGRSINRAVDYALARILPIQPVAAMMTGAPPRHMVPLSSPSSSLETLQRLEWKQPPSYRDSVSPPTAHMVAVWSLMSPAERDLLTCRVAWEKCRQLCDTDEQILAVIEQAKTIPALIVGGAWSVVVVGGGIMLISSSVAAFTASVITLQSAAIGYLAVSKFFEHVQSVVEVTGLNRDPVSRALTHVGLPPLLVTAVGSLRIITVPMYLVQHSVDLMVEEELPALRNAMLTLDEFKQRQIAADAAPLAIEMDQAAALDTQNATAVATITQRANELAPSVRPPPPKWIAWFSVMSRVGTMHGAQSVEHDAMTAQRLYDYTEFGVGMLDAAAALSSDKAATAMYELAAKETARATEVLHHGTLPGRVAMAIDVHAGLSLSRDWLLAILGGFFSATGLFWMHRRMARLEQRTTVNLLQEGRPDELIAALGRTLPPLPALKRAERRAVRKVRTKAPPIIIVPAKDTPVASAVASAMHAIDHPEPPPPTKNPALMRRFAATTCGSDLHCRAGLLFESDSKLSIVAVLALVSLC